MKQSTPYVRIADLVGSAKHQTPQLDRCQHVLGLVAMTFRAIDDMSIEEREDFIKHLIGWALVEKFGAQGQAALSGLQKYCIADCLLDDAGWTPIRRQRSEI
jgi:hypothetical protein